MSGYRSRQEALDYVKYLKSLQSKPSGHCQFCTIIQDKKKILKEGSFFVVTPNIFPYSLWDEMRVTDHLLLIPKQHTDSLGDLPKAAAAEFVDLISDYEKQGYSIYARAPANPLKTVVHQHTHLIKTSHKRHRLLLHVRKPYYRVSL